MKYLLMASILFFPLASSAQALPFAKGDADAGKKSYTQHQCSSCHIKMHGGDGSGIFTRANHKVKSPASLTTQIRSCATNLGLMLFEEEEDHLAAYLNKNFYKFK